MLKHKLFLFVGQAVTCRFYSIHSRKVLPDDQIGVIAARHPQHRIIVVKDGAGWHRSATLKAPTNMRPFSLLPCAPELNPVEHIRDELREKYFHNKAFDVIKALEDQLAVGFVALGQHRYRVKSIVSWDWIINALLNLKWNQKQSVSKSYQGRWATSAERWA